MNEAKIIFDQACAIIDINYNVSNKRELWEIVRALRLLVKANQIEKGPSMLKAKILMCMSSCNYKIGNWTLSYNCALIAKNEISKAVSVSPFDERTTRLFCGEKNCDEIIKTIMTSNPQEAKILLEKYVVTTVDTLKIREVFPLKEDAPFDKEQILLLINVLKQLKLWYYQRAEIEGDWLSAEKLAQCVDVYKFPLIYIWEEYGFGTSEEVWDEGESLWPYNMFLMRINDDLPDLLDILKTESPFKGIEKNEKITNELIIILSDLHTKIKNGIL